VWSGPLWLPQVTLVTQRLLRDRGCDLLWLARALTITGRWSRRLSDGLPGLVGLETGWWAMCLLVGELERQVK
jgi:hypothetical protein